MRLFSLWAVLLVLVPEIQAELPLLPAGIHRPFFEKPGHCPTSVGTWNLQWFPGKRPGPTVPEKVCHEKEAERVIQQLQVDLLLVQEVVDREALKRVAREYPWRVVSSFQRAGDEDLELPVQNMAIFSKVPIRESWEIAFHELPITPDRPVRGILGARLGTRKSGMTVYTLHLKSNRGGREASAKRREKAMEYLRKDWKERGLDPGKDAILVAGDFNCSLRNPDFVGEKTIRELLGEKWVSATTNIPWPQAATVRPDPDGKYPASDFDHILLSPAWAKAGERGRWKAGVLQDSNVPSDHWPVWMRF